MRPFGIADLAVELLSRPGVTHWSVGSGYVFRDRLVLTAAHAVSKTGELIVRFRGVEEHPARICVLGDGSPAYDADLDVAIVEIIDQFTPRSGSRFARIDANPETGAVDITNCWGVGFPSLAQKRRDDKDRPLRESYKLTGYIPVGEGIVEGTATLRLTNAPQGIPAGSLRDTPWHGISGTAVFAGVSIVGVVSEHHPPSGINSLTFVPLDRIDQLEKGRLWWQVLGVDNPAALPTLPPLSKPANSLFVADPVPQNFVHRPDDANALVTELCGTGTLDPTSIVALRGAAGFGKSGLAAWACHQPEIAEAFPDGVLWITLGQNLTEQGLLDRVGDAYRRLDHQFGDHSESIVRQAVNVPRTVSDAAHRFAELLGEHRILVVIDDVWRASDSEPLLLGGDRCARLMTTRFDSVVPDEAIRIEIDTMAANEVGQVLASGISAEDTAAAKSLEPLVGGWVLLARLVNSRLRRELGRGVTIDAAVDIVSGLLVEEGLTALDPHNETSRQRAVNCAIQASVDVLDEEARARYEMLAVFPDGIAIPASLLARWWQRGFGATRGILADLADDSLLQTYDPQQGSARLHDVLRRWLRTRLGLARLAQLHSSLLDVLRPTNGRWTDVPRDDEYVWRYFAWHLSQAGRSEELRETMRSIDYLARKTTFQSPLTVEADFRLALEHCHDLAELADSFSRIAGLIGSIPDPLQMAANLHARLSPETDATWTAPPLYLEPHSAWPLKDIDPRLTRTIYLGAQPGVVTFSHDGRLASGDIRGWVHVWPADGTEPMLIQHGDRVGAAAWSRDGRLATADDSGRLVIWSSDLTDSVDEESGTAVAALAWGPDGSLAAVNDAGWLWRWGPDGDRQPALRLGDRRAEGLAWAPDGSLAASDRGGNVYIWPSNSAMPMVLHHDAAVHDVAWAHDGRLAIGDTNGSVKVFSRDGNEIDSYRFGSTIWSLAWGPGGHLAVAGDPDFIHVWSVGTQEPVTKFRHVGPIATVAWSPDGRLASGGSDGTIRLWATSSTASAADDDAWTACVAFAKDKRLASGQYDGTVRIWPARGGAPDVHHHDSGVSSIAWAPDGRLATGSWNGTINIWSDKTKKPLTLDNDGGGPVQALAWSSDGRLAVGGDFRVRIWPVKHGKPVLLDIGGVIVALAWAAVGRLFSGDVGGTIRESRTNGSSKTLYSHKDFLRGMSRGPDGRIATASRDGSISIWSGQRWIESSIAHTAPLSAISWSTIGLIVGFYDGTLQIIDARVLSGDASARPTAEVLAVFRLGGRIESISALGDLIACASGGVLTVLRVCKLT
jgi:WD40 repeat protein